MYHNYMFVYKACNGLVIQHRGYVNLVLSTCIYHVNVDVIRTTILQILHKINEYMYTECAMATIMYCTCGCNMLVFVYRGKAKHTASMG